MSVDEGVSEVIPEEPIAATTAVTPATPLSVSASARTKTAPGARTKTAPGAPPPAPAAGSEEMSGLQLMERLHTLAAKSADFQERRQQFQKRQREDWRTRTQPVTLEEIQQADRFFFFF